MPAHAAKADWFCVAAMSARVQFRQPGQVQTSRRPPNHIAKHIPIQVQT